MSHDTVLIVDFGSQVTQLIARRVREAGRLLRDRVRSRRPTRRSRGSSPRRSSSPAARPRCTKPGSPRAPQAIFEAGVPVLGICYGQQTMAQQLGGKVEGGHHREFGRADVEIVRRTAPLFDGVWAKRRAPPGLDEPRRPGHAPARGLPASSRVVRERALRRRRRRGAPLSTACMFHPEVVHTPDGAQAARQLRPRRSPACSRRLDDGAPSARRRSPRSAPRSARAG